MNDYVASLIELVRFWLDFELKTGKPMDDNVREDLRWCCDKAEEQHKSDWPPRDPEG